MEPFEWVSPGSITKFNKVVLDLKKESKEITEEVVKELYIKRGGLVIGDPTTQRGVEEGEISFAVLPEAERAEIIKTVKAKRGKK